MQKTIREFGVSPAYFLSSIGEHFIPEQVLSALSAIPALSASTGIRVSSYQPEVFDPETISFWSNAAARRVAQASRESNLRANAFVAHYLGEMIASEPERAISLVQQHFPRACELAELLDTDTVVVPALASPDDRAHQEQALGLALRIAERFNIVLAVEQVPGRALASTAAYLEMVDRIGGPELCLDTGNVFAAGDTLDEIAPALERLVAVHLCDATPNGSSEIPGSGSVPWVPMLRTLLSAGYAGPLTLEIRCPADRVTASYATGFASVMNALREVAHEEELV